MTMNLLKFNDKQMKYKMKKWFLVLLAGFLISIWICVIAVKSIISLIDFPFSIISKELDIKLHKILEAIQ